MPLADDPFTWQVTANQTVRVSRGGRLVAVVGGAVGRRLAGQLADATSERQQLLLARATGNYRRGNERR